MSVTVKILMMVTLQLMSMIVTPYQTWFCTLELVFVGRVSSGRNKGEQLLTHLAFLQHFLHVLNASDLQRPELAHLLNVEEPLSSSARSTAVFENPSLADWFFYHHVVKFMDVFYMGIMGAKDYWPRFEYQHRGSPHVHGIVWLQDAPNVENIMKTNDPSSQQWLIQYIDRTVSTTNPSVHPDGSNISEAQPSQLNPDVCNQPYLQVEYYQQDLNDLIPTCQRHKRCSSANCLCAVNGVQQYRFNFSKPLQSQTVVVRD